MPDHASNTMRVLHVYRTYFPDPPGGLQEAIRQIAMSAVPLGIEAQIFTLSPTPYPPTITRPEAIVIRKRSWLAPSSCDLGGPDAFREFRSLARTADLIHYHFPWPFADVLHLAIRPKTPAVMTYHSDIVRQRMMGMAYSPLMRRMLHSMSRILATSPAYVTGHPNSATDGHLNDASKHERFSLGRPRLVMCL